MTQKNYWPHFIVALVLLAIALGVWTVKVAIDNPVEMDNSYMMSYQQVDEEYYKIEQKARAFERRYRVRFLNEKLEHGKTVLRFVVETKDGRPVEHAKIELLLTRPDTTRHDIKTIARYEDGVYIAQVDLPLEGRWDVIAKVQVGDLYKFYKFRRSTRRVIGDKLKNN